MKLNRILYLGYYLKQLNRDKFKNFIDYASKHTGITRAVLLSDVLSSVFKYNISILEYFQFRFFELSEEEREEWAGTGYMYEYQLRMNPKDQRHILDDKTLFYKHYSDFFVHRVADCEELKNPNAAERILKNPSGKLVFKKSDGKCGAQVEIRDCSNFTASNILQFMQKNDYGLVEEFIDQHPKLNQLSPSAVNTVRVITQLDENGEVDILGSRLRISVDSPVDNMAAGNLAAPVDEQRGIVNGPAVYSDITKPKCNTHPVTKVEINGFKIPYWEETINMVKKAAQLHPQNRSIGWDVVITERGPGLLEGNHDWCKLLWQLPAEKGMKPILESYIDNSVTTEAYNQESFA